MNNNIKPTERELVNFLHKISATRLREDMNDKEFIDWVIWESGRLYFRYELGFDIGQARD